MLDRGTGGGSGRTGCRGDQRERAGGTRVGRKMERQFLPPLRTAARELGMLLG